MSDQPVSVESISHLDGCHFYCWVLRMPDGTHEVTFDEREGSDLALHGRFNAREDRETCQRCWALRRGASPRHERRLIPDYTPDLDAREGFLLTLATVGGIDEEAT